MIYLYKNMAKQIFFFTKICQSNDLSLQKYGKINIYLYKNMTSKDLSLQKYYKAKIFLYKAKIFLYKNMAN
jgi:hypothetical protein